MLALAHDECQRSGDKEPLHRKMHRADTADWEDRAGFQGRPVKFFCIAWITRLDRWMRRPRIFKAGNEEGHACAACVPFQGMVVESNSVEP
jgi:hypothetical protein